MDTFVLDVQNKSVHFLYNNFLLLFYKTKEKEKEFYHEKIKEINCLYVILVNNYITFFK